MNTNETTMLRRIAIAAMIGTWLLSALTVQGQNAAANGTVQGRVYNPASREYVRNAEVRLEGTNRVDYTENDGSFEFRNVPLGPATVSVNYTGYNSARETFTVTAGQTAVREINLTSTADPSGGATQGGVVQLSAFTVSSEREGNAKAIMAQRRDMNITTSVSSDIFGDVTDGNVGEFLKYLPGVDLDYVESEPRGPRLGGMDGQYVGVSFDGMRTASADANRGGGAASRATSFEGFSITSIDSIEINHTASPENDADSPAGTINMKTKRAFDRKGRRIGYNFGLNFNSEEFTFKKTPGPAEYDEEKWKPNYSFDYSESFFNQKFGILLSASQANSYTEQLTSSVTYNDDPTPADPRPLVVRQIDFKDGPKWIRKDALLLTTDWKATPRLTLSLNMVYSYFDGEFWNRNFTFVAANDNANVNNGRARVGGDGLTTVIATRAPTGNINNVATLNNGGGGAAKLTYTRQVSPRFEYKVGNWLIDGAAAVSYSKNNYEAIERGFSNSEGGGVPSSWIATRTSPRSHQWVIRQTSGNDWFNPRSFVNTNVRDGGTRITNDDRTWITEKWTGRLNARWALPFMERFPTSLKFGGKWDEETRDNNNHSAINIWSYVGPGGNTVRVNPTTGAFENATTGNWADVGPQFIAKNPFEFGSLGSWQIFNLNGAQGTPPRFDRNAIATLFREKPDQWVYTGTPENFYTSRIVNARDFRQTVSAGYAQTDIRLTRKLQTRVGLRMEETRTEVTEWDPHSRAEVIAAGYAVRAPNSSGGRPFTVEGMQYQYMDKPRVTRKANYQNWFPSIVFKYQIRPNFDWQAGWNKSIGRPAIDDLTGVFAIDENAQRITIPNRTLLPEFHKKFQTRLGYYFGGRSPGQLTLSFSQVASRNFVQTYDFTPEDFGIDDPDFGNYTVRSKANVAGARRFRNMDFAYNQTLGFLPSEYLRGINVGFNYSRSYASERRSGLAPHRVSSRLGYAYKRFNGTIGMIWVDDKPESGTLGRYFGEITKFDLTLSWRLTRFATLYVQGRNITNVEDRWYQSAPGTPEGENGYLRSIEEYGANWVFGVKGTF
jgi:iron complex outermembrane receptor protein